MKLLGRFFALACICILTACASENDIKNEIIDNAVRSILNSQVQAWNKGNIEEYMSGYYQSDSLRFASGGTITFGWKFVLDRYKKRYSSRELMGTLSFSELDITVISADAAIAFGKWQLKREYDAPWGLFTLLLRQTEQGWRIVHDHTSVGSGE